MDALLSTSLSGMQAASLGMDVAAANVANLPTPGYRRQQVVQTADAGGVSASVRTAQAPGNAPEQDMVDLLASKNQFLANLAVFRTGARLGGTLLDAFA